MRKLAVLLLIVTLSAFAAAPKKSKAKAKTPAPPTPVAPANIAHPMALFLKDLSNDGTRQIAFRATAVGTRFFFEEKAGVTVYRFAGGKYVKEDFLRNTTLANALKRYKGRV